MPTASDDMLADVGAEIADRDSFINQVVETARAEHRDLDPKEMELISRSKDRLTVLRAQIDPIAEASRIATESRERLAQVNAESAARRTPSASIPTPEYRSAGAYICDVWQAGIGNVPAKERIGLYMRAAAHQTTADNLGIIPVPVVGPVLNLVDATRPIVSFLGPMDIPAPSFKLPKVTQHTSVAAQSAEKVELASQKMLISSDTITMNTYGGYLNVSRQDIDFSLPQIMDIVVADLAAQYAITTETVTGTTIKAGSTAQTPVLSTSSTAAEVNAAIWKAVSTIYGAMKGAGRTFIACAPDTMVILGQLFPSVNPQNANSTGFQAGDLAQGGQGSISGIPVVMSAGLASGTILMINTAAAKVFEQRIGQLQVVEPSVLGVQVAYAGYFQAAVQTAAGVIKLTT
jgi:HK97 family phage major capsid protein